MNKIYLTLLVLFIAVSCFSQEIVPADRSLYFKWRTNNIAELGFGAATPNIDFPEPEFDFYLNAGYKAVIFPHLRVGLSYHLFDLTAIKFEEGFMSFDFNTEFIFFPYNRLTPFIFVGSGLNATEDFESTIIKAQGGGGLEFMAMRQLGLKIFADYNYLLEDELEGFEKGDSNDSYIRFGIGVNFYFGRLSKKKNLEGKNTIFNQNKIQQ